MGAQGNDPCQHISNGFTDRSASLAEYAPKIHFKTIPQIKLNDKRKNVVLKDLFSKIRIKMAESRGLDPHTPKGARRFPSETEPRSVDSP